MREISFLYCQANAHWRAVRALIESLPSSCTVHDVCLDRPSEIYLSRGLRVVMADGLQGHMLEHWRRLSAGAFGSLGVISHQALNGDHWPKNFDDIVLWPCSIHELGLRLDRLAAVTQSEEPAAREGENIDFAGFGLIGHAPALRQVFSQLSRFALADVPVLIEGETGTGKELAARALHGLSARSHGPFVPINCGAIPEHLFESEMFGHEKGAFTDAKASYAGLIAQAEGGTLFLDEVDGLSLRGQVALLRFLQDGQFRRIGGRQFHRADVRIVAASNAALAERAANRTFRHDLFFRLNVARIRMPALRDRLEDIPILARHLLDQFAKKCGRAAPQLDAASIAFLMSQTWSGNVRELENFLHRALLLSKSDRLSLAPVPLSSPEESDSHRQIATFRAAKAQIVANFERDYLKTVLRNTGGNISQAARLAGKERRAFVRLLSKNGLARSRALLDQPINKPEPL